MTSIIDQKKYLKKYLSSVKALKKRNKVKKKDTRIKIIDDDLDLVTFNEAVTEDLTGGEIEDAPQIVGVTDERPPELRVNDYKTDMWKSVTVLDSDEETDTVKMIRKSKDQRDHSPPKVKIERSDSDNSPPRRQSSPKLRNRKNCELNDNSPPRKTNKEYSPLRKNTSQRHDTNDLMQGDKIVKKRSSRWNKDQDGNDSSPKRKRNDGYSSPRARSNLQYTSDDNNPPRKTNKDYSPLRKNTSQRRDTNDLMQGDKIVKKRSSRWNKEDQDDDDNSPTSRRSDKESRKTSRNHDDVSPSKKDKYKRKGDDNSPPRKDRSDRYESLEKKRKSGHKERRTYRGDNTQNKYIPSTSTRYDERDSSRTNLNNAQSSKSSDNKRRQIESANLSAGSSNILEATSFTEDKSTISQITHDVDVSLVKQEASDNDNNVPKTILRNRKTGRIRNLREEAAAKKEKEKEKEAIQEKYSRWGKGLKQVDDANEKRAQDLHEMQKPLARYADDVDLEDMLKNREREGDPMLEYLRKKKREKAINDPNATPEKPVFQGDCGPANRYGIKPGYRWDGVDRSNGFEKKYFEVQNARRAHQTESYKWSSEDM